MKKNKRSPWACIPELTLVSLAVPACGFGVSLESEQPNLLLIYTDDQRWDAISYVTPYVYTPNLERLAREGMRFTQATVVLPVCSPSRAAVLTGRYGLANGQTTFSETSLNPTEVTFMKYLRDAGYLTAQVGKWHIYGRDPLDLEFDEVRNTENTKDFWQPLVINNGRKVRAPGAAHDYVVDETISIIKKAREQKQPFAIYLATLEPHNKMFGGGGRERMQDETRLYYEQNPLNTMQVPPNIYDDLTAKPPYLQTYRGRTQRTGEGGKRPMTPKRYWDCQYASFTMMTEIDRALGRLFSALEEMDLRRSTYILFMGDNGLFQGEHGLMSKALHYEESVRVPFFAVGPGISPGLDEQSLITNIDIAPTLLEFAGLSVPDNMHGMSLKKVLLEQTPLERDYVLLEHPDVNPVLETRTAFGLRSDRWKYIRTYEDGKDKPYTFEELYDLKEDPYEMQNLATDPERAPFIRLLREELEMRRKDVEK